MVSGVEARSPRLSGMNQLGKKETEPCLSGFLEAGLESIEEMDTEERR